jgi:hypothetical protein
MNDEPKCENTQDVTVTVYPELNAGTIKTSTPTICSGTQATLTTEILPTSGDQTYSWQWEHSDDGSTGWLEISGEISEEYTTLITLTGTKYYRRTVKTSSCTATTPAIPVTVTPELTSAETITASASTVCSGTMVTLTGSDPEGGDGTGTYTYQWQKFTTGSGWEDIGTSEDYTESNLTATTEYQRIVTSGACTVTSSPVIVNVNPYATAAMIDIVGKTTICPGTTTTLTVSAASGFSGTPAFKWYNASGDYIQDGNIFEPAPSVTTIYYVSISSADYCENKSGARKDVTVTVQPPPTLTANSLSYTVCSGVAMDYELESSTSNVTFSWERQPKDGVTPVPTSIVGKGMGKITETLTNSTDASIEVIYKVTVTMNDEPKCENTQDVTVTVYPEVTIPQETPTAICSGTTFEYTPLSSVSGIKYNWTREKNTYINGGAEGSGTGVNSISEILENTSDAAIEVTYTITPTANGCTGTPQTVMVTVNLVPDALSIEDVTTCYDGQEHKALETIDNQSIFWYSDESKAQSTNVPSQTTVGTSTAAYPAIKATTGCESAVGNPVTVTVNELPTAPSIDNITASYDGQEHEVIEPAVEGQTIVWYKDATGDETAEPPSRTEVGTITAYAAAKIIATGCESSTRTAVTVTVNRIAIADDITVTGEQTICSGSTTALTANSNIINPEYKWYLSQDADTPFHTGDEYTTPELTGEATYYISVSGDDVNENVTGDRKEVTITVNQIPELISPLELAIYSGYTFTYTAESSIDGTEFRWERSGIDEISQPASTGETNVISETLTNLTEQSTEVDYLITVTSPDGCTATQTVTVTVYPKSESPKITGVPVPFSVCDQEIKVLEVTSGTVDGTSLSYQWYSNTVNSIEGGEAVPDAVDSRYRIPGDLPVGKRYYYCMISSDYYATPVYSEIVTVTVEPNEVNFVSLSVNGEPVSIQSAESEYKAPCGETALLDIVTSSNATVIINGVNYSENREIRLVSDKTETEVVIYILSCTGDTVYRHILTILHALPSKLLYQRWDDVIAVNRNPENNGNFLKADILGVRWYKREDMFSTKWFIELDSPETDYRAEINLSGKWHKICGAPVRREAPSKQIIAYPNPILTGETLTVELFAGLEEANMNIYTLTGSTVKQNIPLPSKFSTTAIDLDPGLYILEIVAQNKKHGITKRELFKLIVGNY